MLTDNSPMPFGKKHRGTPMDEVPFSYLEWFYDQIVTKKYLNYNERMVKVYYLQKVTSLQSKKPATGEIGVVGVMTWHKSLNNFQAYSFMIHLRGIGVKIWENYKMLYYENWMKKA